MSSDYPLKNFTYPVKPTIDETNPHNLPLLPEDVFDPLFENLKKMAIGYLSKYDPSHADLYQSILPEADKLLNPQFKVQMREFFAGCFDKESPMFQQLCRNVVGKLGTYLRFAKEKEMYQEQLDKIQIKKPLFVLSLPRSGSTYVHTLLASDPKASAIRFYEHMQPGSHTMNSDSRKKLVSDVMNQVHNDANASELNIIHNMDDVMRFEEEMFFMEMLGQCFMMTCGLPRLEKYRSHLFDYDFHYVYDALLDEFKMHIEEFPLKKMDISV
ncbi:Sulfotransferase [Entamoeba marina]